MDFAPGQNVQFNQEFAHKNTLIHIGDEGIVDSIIGGHISVLAKRQYWTCRPWDIRPAGTEITPKMRQQMASHWQMIQDFMEWLDKQDAP